MLNPKSSLYIVLLGLIFACGSLGTDIFAPAQPAIASQLNASDFEAQLVMSVYYAGLAIAQLVFGVLSDRFGRKPVLRIGLWVFALSTFLGGFASSIETLIILRFLQGFTASAGLVVARAIARDHFEGPNLGRTMSYMSLTLSLSPVLLPPIGGLLTSNFGWQANFFVLGAIVLCITIWMEASITESLKKEDRKHKSISIIFNDFVQILKNREFLIYMITGGLCFAGLFAYISNASLVFRDFFNSPAEQIGAFLGLTFLGHSAGAFTGGKLALRIGSSSLMSIGAILCLTSGSLMFAMSVLGVQNIMYLLVFISIYLFGAGWVYPQSLAGALHPFSKTAGAASAMMGFSVMMISSITSTIVGGLYNGTPTAMTGFIAIVSALSFLSYFLLIHFRTKKA